jgi:hypothetical protein
MSATIVLTTDDVARRATERLARLVGQAQGYLAKAQAEIDRIVPTNPWAQMISTLTNDVYAVCELRDLCFGALDLEAGERIHDAVMATAEAFITMAHTARLAAIGRTSADLAEVQP